MAPDAIHIATEGPIGWCGAGLLLRHKLAFTTSYTTRFPEYVVGPHRHSGRASAMRCCGAFTPPPPLTMIATASLRQELGARGFRKLGFWTRGVDTELFNPDCPAKLDLPRPIFMTMGRVAVEKNLEAFLSLDLPGSKVVVGDGPQKASLAHKYPDVKFLGEKKGQDLTSHLAAADVFVFPSLTDTFGVVQLEALACGTPVAAFPVTGPLDVIADHPIGALDQDLRNACLRAPGCRAKLAGISRSSAPGKIQCAAVHRQSDGAAAEPFAATRLAGGRQKRRARLIDAAADIKGKTRS